MTPDHLRSTPVRVALSNDHDLVLRGLAAMLQGHDEIEVVDASVTALLRGEPHIVLFDTYGRLPRHDDKLRAIVAGTSARVVVYSWDDYPEDVARGLGAAGCLHKGISAAELAAELLAVHRGEDRFAPVATGRGAAGQEEPGAWPGRDHGLSAREAEMLTFIAMGLTNEEIARRSFLSVNSVKTYARSAYRKIGVSRRSQAVGWAISHDILTPSH